MVIWSEPARADLRSIHDFISHDSPWYAKQVVQDIRARAESAEQFPKAGRKVAELNDEQIREISVYSYRVIYDIRGRDMCVLGVIHKRRVLKAEYLQ